MGIVFPLLVDAGSFPREMVEVRGNDSAIRKLLVKGLSFRCSLGFSLLLHAEATSWYSRRQIACQNIVVRKLL